MPKLRRLAPCTMSDPWDNGLPGNIISVTDATYPKIIFNGIFEFWDLLKMIHAHCEYRECKGGITTQILGMHEHAYKLLEVIGFGLFCGT